MSEALDPKKLSKAVKAYHDRIAALRAGGNTTELQLRPAFRDLLDGLSPLVGWQFQDETTTPTATAAGSIRPDGRLSRNDFPYGLWEAKGPESKLKAKVAEKIDQGYPLYNLGPKIETDTSASASLSLCAHRLSGLDIVRIGRSCPPIQKEKFSKNSLSLTSASISSQQPFRPTKWQRSTPLNSS